MHRLEQARVLIRVAFNLIKADIDHNDDYDEKDKVGLRAAVKDLSCADFELHPYAPDMGDWLKDE